MSNVIAFLESLGTDAAKARLAGDDYIAAVEALALDDAPRQALLDRDAAALGQLSGARLQMMCILLPADGDDNKKDDDQDGQDEPGDGDQKESIRQFGHH